MEKYKNLKKGTKVGLIISAILLAAVLVNNVFNIVPAFNDGRISPAVMAIIDDAMCVIIMLYAFFGYRKPHGNMLKFVFFAYAISLALQGTVDIAAKSLYISGDLCILAGLLVAFVAGRLHKIEKNKFILIFVGLLLLAKEIIFFVTVPVSFVFLRKLFSRITPIIIFAVLSFAYAARFEEHKAAGLAGKATAAGLADKADA